MLNNLFFILLFWRAASGWTRVQA